MFLMVSLTPVSGPEPVFPSTSEESDLQPVSPFSGRSPARGEGDNVELDFEDREPNDDEMMRNETHRFILNVTNTGAVADIIDIAVEGAADGWEAIAEISEINLAAGAWGRFYLDIQSPRDAVSNKDFNVTATSSNDPGDYNYALLSIILNTDYMVDVGYPKDGNETSGNRGDTVIYSIEFFNIGDQPDDYYISYSALPKDWSATVTPNEVDGVPAHSDPQPVELKITVADNAEVDEKAQINMIVTSKSYANIDSDQETTTTAADGRTYGVVLDAPDGNESSIIPDSNTSYLIEVANEGNEEDTIQLSHTEATGGWTASLSETTLVIPAASSINVQLDITAPGNAQQDDAMLISVTGFSDNRPQHRDELTTTTSIRIPVRDFELEVDQTELDAEDDLPVFYYMNLTNKGTDPDNFILDLEDSGNTDWNFNLELDRIDDLAVDETQMFYLRVRPFNGRQGGEQGWANVSATSEGNDTIAHAIQTLTTVKTKPNFNLIPNPIIVTVFPGDAAYFNFSVFNSGNIPDSYTVEVSGNPAGFSAQLDTTRILDVLRGGQKAAELVVDVDGSVQPKSVKYTVTVTSDEDGSLVKEAEVTIEVVPYAEIELTVPSATGATDPGKTYGFDLTVTNNGNEQENFTLQVEDMPAGWNANFFQGTSLLTGELILSSGAQANLQLKVTPDAEDLAATHSFTMRIISGVSPSVEESRLLTLEVNEYYAFTLTPDSTTDNNAEANKTGVTFQFTVTNTGNILDYYTPAEPTWPADWSGAILPTSSFSLQPDDTRVVTFTVNIPLSAKGGWTNLTPTVTSSSLPGAPAIYEVNLKIASRSQVAIEKVDWINEIYTGQTKTLKVKITNAGNEIDNLTLLISGASSWITYAASSSRLAPGDSKEIGMDLTVPSGTTPTQYTVTVTVVSETDDTKTAKTVFSFTVYEQVGGDPTPDDSDDSGGGFIPALSTLGTLGVLAICALAVTLRVKRRI